MLIVGWLLGLSDPCRAESGAGTSAIAIVPADGRARGIQLRTQTVDATITEDEAGVWADTKVTVLLHNPGAKQVVVPVGLPDPQPNAMEMPADLEASIGKTPLLLQHPEQASASALALTAPITVPTKGSVSLTIKYRQALTLTDGIRTFSYPLTAAAGWTGNPESVRVTVRFQPAADPHQILAYAPGAARRDMDGLTWHLENRKPTQDIVVLFIGPAWWSELQAAQAAAAAPGADLDAYLELAHRYRRLADIPHPAFDPAAGFFDRYYPMTLAALQAGLATADASADPASAAAAHWELALLYEDQATRSAADAREELRMLAAQEAASAAKLLPSDDALQRAAIERYAGLLDDAVRRADQLTAGKFEAELMALQSAEPAGMRQEQAEGSARAVEAIMRGDVAAARAELSEAFGPQAAALPATVQPRAAQVIVTVTTSPTERKIAVALTPVGAPDETAELVQQAVTALAAWGHAEGTDTELAFSLPFTDTRLLSQAQVQAARALPPQPEWALLAAVLQPKLLTVTAGGGPALIADYVESIDLGSALAEWNSQAMRLEEAALQATEVPPRRAEEPGRIMMQQIGAVRRALGMTNATTWRNLAALSRVIYRVEMASGAWEWHATPGAARTIETHSARPEPPDLTLVLCPAALIFLLALVQWRTG